MRLVEKREPCTCTAAMKKESDACGDAYRASKLNESKPRRLYGKKF
jgi:hypothetical protein